MTQLTSTTNNMEDSMNNLTNLFPSVDRAFLEDVYVSSKKDYDKTVDMLLSMGIDMEVGKKDQKQAPTPTPVPTYTPPMKPQSNNNVPSHLYPNPASYPAVSSPNSPQLPPPMVPTHSAPLQPTILTPTPGPMIDTPSVSYPPRNMQNMYTTPPPILSPTSPVVTSPTPTAPPAISLNSSQVDQKRMETMKQELSLEYQKINDKHKYNLELQQKLEQLSEFTTSEQRKLEEQRALFAEEKRRFTEELSTRFKALEDDYQRQRDELQKHEEQRVQFEKENEENRAVAKEEKKRLKQLQKEEAAQLQRDAEVERNELVDVLKRRLQDAELNLEDVLQEKNNQIKQLRENSEAEIDALKERVQNLERQLKTSQYETSAEVLSYFSSIVSTLAGGIHAVSIERANNVGENGEMSETAEPLKDLKRTFFRTVNDQLGNVSL